MRSGILGGRDNVVTVHNSQLSSQCAPSSSLLQELRRVRSGILGDRDNMATMHDTTQLDSSLTFSAPPCCAALCRSCAACGRASWATATTW